MQSFLNRYAFILIICMICITPTACTSSKYDRLPAATQAEFDAMRERYLALIKEAESIGEKEFVNLLHHFSRAALSNHSWNDFQDKATAFIRQSTQGGLKSIEMLSARSPGKVRLLMISTPQGKKSIPFVRGADGWVIDDIDLGFLSGDKEPLLTGTMPAASPSVLVPIATLQDSHTAEFDQVTAALSLSCSGCDDLAKQYLKTKSTPWLQTALWYAIWKAGGGCTEFSKSFPLEKSLQTDLYQADSKTYRILLQGLFGCAASSKSMDPILKIYRGCHQVDGGARSEYVDLLVGSPDGDNEALKTGLANIKPESILKASLKLDIPYEEDPVANILVGGLHGEKDSHFVKYISSQSGSKTKLGKKAKTWAEKMSVRDKMEPVED